MNRSLSRHARTPNGKVKSKRNTSNDTEEGSRRFEEIRRLVESGQYHISAIDLGRRMLAYYSHHDS